MWIKLPCNQLTIVAVLKELYNGNNEILVTISLLFKYLDIILLTFKNDLSYV